MCHAARDGRHLANLVSDAAALCKAADDQLPARTGPGRPDVFARWQVATLILVPILCGRKSKSAQHRFLRQHRRLILHDLRPTLRLDALPSRATYMRRYATAWPVFERAIELGGRKALARHVGQGRVVAVDKSMIAARGPVRPRHLTPDRPPRAVDLDAGWGKSAHDGWVWGYSYEVVVCAGKHGRIVPLLASADRASRNEHRSFADKIPCLPRVTRYVLGDGGYDGNALAEAIEYDARGDRRRPTGRHLLTPLLARGGRPAVGQTRQKGTRERHRQHRVRRQRLLQSVRGRRLYRRRLRSVEPFHQWFKHCFDLETRVWHRGLDNNRTMLLATLLLYQCLQCHNARCKHTDGAVQWVLDAL